MKIIILFLSLISSCFCQVKTGDWVNGVVIPNGVYYGETAKNCVYLYLVNCSADSLDSGEEDVVSLSAYIVIVDSVGCASLSVDSDLYYNNSSKSVYFEREKIDGERFFILNDDGSIEICEALGGALRHCKLSKMIKEDGKHRSQFYFLSGGDHQKYSYIQKGRGGDGQIWIVKIDVLGIVDSSRGSIFTNLRQIKGRSYSNDLGVKFTETKGSCVFSMGGAPSKGIDFFEILKKRRELQGE